MAGKKIGELTPLGRNLISTDELELSLTGSAGSRKITGAQIIGAAGGVSSVTASTPLVSTGGLTPNLSILQANGSQSGFLFTTDWNTFNNKQAALVSGTNIKTINSNSLLGSGNIAVQPTLVSGTNIRTINGTTLLASGDIAVQPTLVSGTNIKTINGTSVLGSGDLVIGSNKVSQGATFINQYVAAGGFTNTPVFSPSPIILSSLGQIIDIDLLFRNQIFGSLHSLRCYKSATPGTIVGANQLFYYQFTPSVADQVIRYFRRFVISRDGGLNWILRSMDPYIIPNDFDSPGITSSVLNPYTLGFAGVSGQPYLIFTINNAAEMMSATIEY